MSPEDRLFDVPVLLVPPDHTSDHHSASGSTAEKYRYLINIAYKHQRHERAYISDLIDFTVKKIRTKAQSLKLHPDSEVKVKIYELEESVQAKLRNQRERKKAYQVVDNAVLEGPKRCLLHPRVSLSRAKMLPENLVAIIIPISAIIPPAPLMQPLYMMQGVDKSHAQIRREDIATAARKRSAPSNGATIAGRMKTQNVHRPDAVYNYRPLTLAPPPITIYHPVFAKFLRIMMETQEFTHEELNHAQGFVRNAVKYYRSEGDRAQSSSALSAATFSSILTSLPFSSNSGRLKTDGGVAFNDLRAPNDFIPVGAILEIKPDTGVGNSDPLAQNECDYAAMYSSEEAQPVRQACCCPVFLIGMAGPNITVAGAVFADQLVAQPLTDYISVVPRLGLTERSPLDDAGHRIARLFRALKECIKDLEKYYSDVVVSISPPPQGPVSSTGSPHPFQQDVPLQAPAMIGPHFTEFRDSAGQVVALSYKERLAREFSWKAVFIAEAKTEFKTETVVVKFAHTYNSDAHKLLANAEPPQAPKLRYCAHEPSVGMWVVVMDYVETKGLADPVPIPSLRKAVMTLHDSGLVFGDLRAPNILFVEDRVMLVDFDWCGKAGEARYPSDICLDGRIDWHPGVQRGGLIEKEHDAHLFRGLTGQEL